MSTIYLHNEEIHTCGELPEVGQKAPEFCLTDIELMPKKLSDYKSCSLIISVFPSLDTNVCFGSTKALDSKCLGQDDYKVVTVSVDTPFALNRIQAHQQFKNISLLSDFRNRSFGAAYGLVITDGPLAGLLARALIVLDKKRKVVHTELVKNIEEMPDIDKALASLKK